MKEAFFLLVLTISFSAQAGIDRIEVDANLISKSDHQMVVKIGKKRITLPVSRKIPTEKKMKNGMIRVSVLPSELISKKR